MHSLIYVLVETASEADAISEAEDVLADLCGATPARYGPYDSYRLFDGDDREELVARWRELPTVAQLDAEPGSDMVEAGLRQHTEAFHRNFNIVRNAIVDHPPEAVMASDRVRTAFQRLGARRGPPVTLYNEFGDGIRSQERLTTHVRELTDGDRTGWVVPADVHH